MPAKQTQFTYNGFNAHELGEVSVMSQSSKFMPDKLGQKEIRQIHIKIETFEQDYDTNYNLMQQARAAFSAQNKIAKWITADTVLDDDGVVAGTKVLEHPAIVLSHDLPEEPNAWGTYNQFVNIVLEYELDVASSGALPLTFHRTDSTGAAANLGHVHQFKKSYRASKFSEFRSARERASGGVTASGEIFIGLSESGGGTDTRRATLLARKESLETQIKGRNGTLLYGPSEAAFFNKVVKVVAFDIDIDEAVNSLKWSLSVDYTEFPDESGYAAADFTFRATEDRESGEMVLGLSGKVGAATLVLANAKLDSLKAAVLKAAGFPAGLIPLRTESTPRFVNANDTQTQLDGTATSPTADMGANNSPNLFIELSFDVQWRKRSSTLVSYTLKIVDDENTTDGLIHRSYSGVVVAGGVTATQAYNTAVDKARELGDKKHAFRMDSKITRSDRQIEATGTQEFISVDFSFEYKLKGDRIYLEMNTEALTETFGENTLRVSGFVMAVDYSSAKTAYQTQVRKLYATNLIRTETTSDAESLIQMGVKWLAGTNTKQFSGLFTRFDFSLSVWLPKPDTTFSLQYGMRVEVDYVALHINTVVEGTYYASQANLTSSASGADGNPLDTFLATLGLGNRLHSNRTDRRERTGVSEFKMGLGFSNAYIRVLPASGQILECEVSEEMQYSGIRCGNERGSRTVTGTVTATDETTARVWMKQQSLMAFPSGIGGGATPGTRYKTPPKVGAGFSFIPLDVGVARGGEENFRVVKFSFSFHEHLPHFPYSD